MKNIFGKFGFKKGEEFDLDSHLQNNNFAKHIIDDGLNKIPEHIGVYSHRNFRITITLDYSKNNLSVSYNNELISMLNFIPDSELFSDMFLTYVASNVKNI